MCSPSPADEARVYPERAVLDDVPRIGYDVHLCPFVGSLYAALQYIGDTCDYNYLMGVTGACFRRLWNRDDGGNVDLMYLAPEPYRRASEALGYELRPVTSKDKAALVAALKESIARLRPVLAFGIIGPPECGVVAGYDLGGEVLIGYSYFQEDTRRGYYHKGDWYESAAWAGDLAFLVLGDKKPGPPPDKRIVLISALEWALDLERTPKRPNLPNHASGLAAYEAWATGLETDADYPADKPDVLATRGMVQGDQCVMLCERGSAASFLRSMAAAVPEVAEELTAAAELYDQAGTIGPALWSWPNWAAPEAIRAIADPARRREYARQVRAAADLETKAVGHLAAALQALKAPPEEPAG
jgi:hypothetical protein